jgi:hypothetical protein
LLVGLTVDDADQLRWRAANVIEAQLCRLGSFGCFAIWRAYKGGTSNSNIFV